jgi:ergothioneine biosynthesis protein EgtC
MCRFTLYMGPPLRLGALLVEPRHSLIHQSHHSAERDEPLNGDGFGVAWYAPALSMEPAVFRSISPAWNNANLLHLARVVESPCILAHVRAATSGAAVNESNCHPFSHGRFAFMHNGDIGGFSQLRRPLLAGLSDDAFHAIRGTTDSEHVFALLLDRLGRGASLEDALHETVDDVRRLMATHAPDEHAYLNVAVTDGTRAVALRYTTDAPERADTLYINSGHRYTCEGGVCRMIEPERERGAALVSSERLSDDSGWDVVPVNHIVAIDEDRSVRVVAFD